jgi:hypothetical protein
MTTYGLYFEREKMENERIFDNIFGMTDRKHYNKQKF